MKNGNTFRQLLSNHCVGIEKKVLGEMLPNRFHVGGAKKIPVPNEAILYRWWFPENSPVMDV